MAPVVHDEHPHAGFRRRLARVDRPGGPRARSLGCVPRRDQLAAEQQMRTPVPDTLIAPRKRAPSGLCGLRSAVCPAPSGVAPAVAGPPLPCGRRDRMRRWRQPAPRGASRCPRPRLPASRPPRCCPRCWRSRSQPEARPPRPTMWWITGGAVVPAGQTAGDVVVLDGGVRIAGRVTGDVVSVSGPVRVTGVVACDLIAVSDRSEGAHRRRPALWGRAPRARPRRERGRHDQQ
jgi:hypothetical protein